VKKQILNLTKTYSVFFFFFVRYVMFSPHKKWTKMLLCCCKWKIFPSMKLYIIRFMNCPQQNSYHIAIYWDENVKSWSRDPSTTLWHL